MEWNIWNVFPKQRAISSSETLHRHNKKDDQPFTYLRITQCGSEVLESLPKHRFCKERQYPTDGRQNSTGLPMVKDGRKILCNVRDELQNSYNFSLIRCI